MSGTRMSTRRRSKDAVDKATYLAKEFPSKKRGRVLGDEELFTTPSPVVTEAGTLSGAERQILTLKRKKEMFSELDPTQSILSNLPKEIVSKILFSGYFSTVEVTSVIVRVCKEFRNLCQTQLRAADLRCSSASNVNLQKAVIGPFRNVVFLDLRYTRTFHLTVDLICMTMTNLLGLSLRGCGCINNNSLGKISRLTQLRYLDISKSDSAQKDDITDACLPSLAPLNELELLNLAFTNVTPAGILPMLASWKKLRHVSFQCCMFMDSDNLFRTLALLPLKTLDITGTLCEDRHFSLMFQNTVLSKSLQSLACSHLPFGTGKMLDSLLMNDIRLKHLDMRGFSINQKDMKINREVAKGLYDVVIFEPADQPTFGSKKVFQGIDYVMDQMYDECR